MKKYILLFIYTNSLLTFLIIVGCGREKEYQDKTTAELRASYGEDIIDFIKHEVSKPAGQIKIDFCYNNVLMDSIVNLNKDMDTIDTKYFQPLRDEAFAIKKDTFNHILALRITFGYDSVAHKMIYFYQPLYLKRVDTASSKVNVRYYSYPASTIYKYKKNIGFKVVNDSPVNIAKAALIVGAYKRHVTLKHFGSNWYDLFNYSADSTGSVKSLVFSFQEIDSVMQANKVQSVILHNSADYETINGKKYLKHSVLLGFEGMKFRDPVFLGKYGNLSHLCPPSCNYSYHYFDLR